MTNANKRWRKSEENKLVEKVNEYLQTLEWDAAFEKVSIDLGRTARGCKDRWNIIHARKRKVVVTAAVKAAEPQQSNVEHPSHYQVAGGKEVIELMEEGMTKEQFEGFLMGNVLKYMYRYPYKNGVEDLKKANEYLRMLIKLKTEE